MPKYFKAYLVWAILVFVLVFAKGKFSADNVTHMLILGYLALSLWAYKKFGKSTATNIRKEFILFCVISASIVEGFYMIYSPILPSLRFTAGMAVGDMVKNYAIDVLLTAPAYYVIFRVVWYLINKYQYNAWQFIILFGLGQGLGDGSRSFLANPGLLIFIPYVLINYHAMNAVPFLRIQDRLPANRSNSIFKYFAPIIILPLTYIFCALIIFTVAGVFKIK